MKNTNFLPRTGREAPSCGIPTERLPQYNDYALPYWLVYPEVDHPGEWGLLTEPWTFVLDEDGTVAARLGGPASPQELADELAKLGAN